MITKDKATALAYQAANKSGHIHFIVRLNPFSNASWAVREWSASLAANASKEDGSVIACCPHA